MSILASRKARTEAGNPGAQERRRVSGVHVLRDRNDGLRAQSDVLGVTAVAQDAIDVLMLAGDEIALAAARAVATVAAVPRSADALPELPVLLRGGDRDDLADNLVSGDARVRDREGAVRDMLVAGKSNENC